MAFKPANCEVNIQEYPLSTSTVTKGSALGHIGTPGAAGYIASGALTSAEPVVAVAAETKNGIITGRSALASTTDDGDHLLLGYPASTESRFLAVCSSTPTVTMLDVAWGVTAGTVMNETSTEPQFLIESIVSATDKTVLGRFVSAQYVTRVVVAPGS
jgi:hypothetical protein